jgi:UDP-glucose:(heptosyl)LPS alpha-1,3-glucosyltransferase
LEKYSLRLIEALKARGHEVTILSTTKRDDLHLVKVCRRLHPSALNMLWFDYHCRRYLHSHLFDIVIGFDRHFFPLTYYRAGNGCHAAFLARRMQTASAMKRLLLRLNPLHWLTRWSERLTFERMPPRAIICNSHLVQEEIKRYYPKTPPERLIAIHNGVEWHEFEPAFREKMALSHSSSSIPQLLFIGHEWGRKGLERLMRALALISDRSFHLTAVGRERHGDRFVQLAQRLGISHKVTLIPTPQRSAQFYRTAHIMIIPSHYDPFANVTLEALAMGLYVITTRANGGFEVITPGINGDVLDEDASDGDLSRAIALALPLASDPSLPTTIRESVREYDFSKKLDEYVTLIETQAPLPSAWEGPR